jgi:thioredoxin reductase (NADPH)
MAVENVTIVGSGPAGYTAAIYCARANLNPLQYLGEPQGTTLPGGQLMLTSDVENYPGFPKGVQGPELMKLFREQAERFGTRMHEADIHRVDFSSRPFKLWSGETLIESRTVIIATGASAIWLNLVSEQRLMGRGVTSCATCDGAFHKGNDVAVVGGGDSAMEEALYLSNICKTVTVIHRRDALRASKIMQQRAFDKSNIKFMWDSAVEEVLGEKKVTGVRVKNLKKGVTADLSVTGLFVAIGHKPNTEVFRGQVELDEKGYIRVFDNSTRTSVKGVFACGDVQDHVYRQAVTAAGTGCMAALDAERSLGH